MYDALQPHESQHARPPCPSPTPWAYSNLCPSSQWCHPAISSSVVPSSSFSVHGIHQARILEWVVYPFARGSFQPRDRTQVSWIAGGFLTISATREALLYSTENYIQHPVINHNGKESKKRIDILCVCVNIYTHITESLCYTAEINTTL